MRSPLKEAPLRNPGQSLDAELTDIVFDALQYVVAAIFLIVLAALEWLRQFFGTPPTPILHSVIALFGVGICVYKLPRILKRGKAIRLGRDGERSVGQLLEELRESGSQVFHDVPADGFNIDHVVIGRNGVYLVETKTLSKPEKGRHSIVFDGETITKLGQPLDRDPVSQAEAGAKYLEGILKQSSGRSVRVQPIVTFPGWFVESKSHTRIWVLNPNGIPSFIAKSRASISSEDAKMYGFHLTKYIQSYK